MRERTAMVSCRECRAEYPAITHVCERRYGGVAYRIKCPWCGTPQLYSWAMRRRRMPDAVLIRGGLV
jgi:hypothetical protein